MLQRCTPHCSMKLSRLVKVKGLPTQYIQKYVDTPPNISATTVADRCIKSSTQQCNLYRHTLAVRSAQNSSVLGCNTHYQVPNCLWNQHQHNNCSELHEMGFCGRAAAHKPKFADIGLWRSRNTFNGVMNPASPSGSPTD